MREKRTPGRVSHKMQTPTGRVVTGGKRNALGGTFCEPTVSAEVTTAMVITKEETFGRWRRSTASRPMPRHRPNLARRRGSRIRHRRHQRKHHLDQIHWRDRPFGGMKE